MGLLPGAAFRADFADGFIDDMLHLIELPQNSSLREGHFIRAMCKPNYTEIPQTKRAEFTVKSFLPGICVGLDGILRADCQSALGP
jgi:hypothetical protein